MTTKQKVAFLQEYLKKWYKDWHSIHSNNIVGFRVGKKMVNNVESRHYSIIFHVIKKKANERLKMANEIPKYIEIKFPDGIVRRVKTDVEQTGMPRLHMSPIRKPTGNGRYEVGTIGLFLKDRSNNVYALTNFHVAGWDYMLRNEFSFSGIDTNVFIDNIRCSFEEGIISNEIDAAFIRIADAVRASNRLSDGTIIRDYIEGPITIGAVNQVVNVYGLGQIGKRPTRIHNNSAIFYTGFRNIVIEDVILLNPVVTNKGNSGCPVMVDDSLLGIIVGGDRKYSYAIPYFKIRNFKPLDIL